MAEEVNPRFQVACYRGRMKPYVSVVLLLLAFILMLDRNCSCYSGGVDKQEINRLAELRREGLSGDRSQLNGLIAIVQKPFATNPKASGPSMNELLVLTALRALTRLSATEAMADVDSLIKQTDEKYPDLANFATVQRARLQAELEVAALPDTSGKVSVRIEAFYKALGMTPAALNAGVRLYRKQFYADANGRSLPRPIEVYAMREIADMIYHGSYQAMATMPEVSTLDFSLDAPSALKMRLAQFSGEYRARRLVAEIIAGQASPEIQDYQLQLLVDEGKFGSQAIAQSFISLEQQTDTEHKKEQKKSLAGLFRELSAIGDQEQIPLIKQYLEDSDSTVREEAKSAVQRIDAGDKSIFPKAVDF